ncbi:MAG: glycerol-3-phosphate 1-O-acyltransferase PlsY [Chloroflexi bacterium]|nr:glycerol-3-phosphate 1-O-acyltransferase PlsY [Chloroflexota bacterium]
MTGNILAVVIAYFLGAVPIGLTLARLVKGVDIRRYGSGKTGATNVLRTLGVKAAVAVLLLDIGKGVAAVYIARALGDSPWAASLAGIAAVCGHIWSVYIRFTGGRGVNTGLGALLAIAPLGGLVTVVVALSVMALWKFVSLGSIIGAAVGAFAIIALAAAGRLDGEYVAFGSVVATLIIAVHRDNIQRLLSGTERKLGQKVAVEPQGEGAR